MEEFDSLSDGEFLYRLRLEYANALKLGDFQEINDVIMPGFWDRFGRYYKEFEKSWKSLPPGTPVHLVLDPADDKTLKIDWMDHVLQGRIDLDLSADL